MSVRFMRCIVIGKTKFLIPRLSLRQRKEDGNL